MIQQPEKVTQGRGWVSPIDQRVMIHAGQDICCALQISCKSQYRNQDQLFLLCLALSRPALKVPSDTGPQDSCLPLLGRERRWSGAAQIVPSNLHPLYPPALPLPKATCRRCFPGGGEVVTVTIQHAPRKSNLRYFSDYRKLTINYVYDVTR